MKTYYTAFCFKCAELGLEQVVARAFDFAHGRDYLVDEHEKHTGHTVVRSKVRQNT